VQLQCAIIDYENAKVKPVDYLVQIIDLNDPNDQQQKRFPKRQELVSDPTLARAIDFYNIYHQMCVLIEQGRIIIYYRNTSFIYHNEFSKYIKVEWASSKDVFDYVFDVGVGKFLSEKGKKYLHELFEKLIPKHLQLDEDFDDYLDNDGLKDIIEDEGMQNLNMNN